MKLPIPKNLLQLTDTHITLFSGTDENGENIPYVEFDTKCRVELNTSISYNKEGKQIRSKGKAFVFDHCKMFSKSDNGSVTVNDLSYEILNHKFRCNPDGTINHVELELM